MSKIYIKYLELKRKDNDKHYLFRSGNFYIFIADDAKKISDLTTLKLTNLSKDVVKCGFPLASLDKYLNLFKNLNLDVSLIEEIEGNKVDSFNNKDKNIDDLLIYKEYLILLNYTEMIVLKYPKVERNILVYDIRKKTYSGIEKIICANLEYDKKQRFSILKTIDADLKMLKVMIRISYQKKYINSKNYHAWSKKITNIELLLRGWIRRCLKG